MKLLLLSVLLGSTCAWAQNNFQYSVTVTELKALADDNDGFGFSGPQDPVYNMWVSDEALNESTKCWIFEDDANADYDVWTDIADYEIANVSGVNTTTITVDMAGHESDAAGAAGCSPDSGDDAQYTRTTVSTIDLTGLPEGVPNAMTINLDGVYYAKIEVTWTNLSASIDENTTSALNVYPNPSKGTFQLTASANLVGKELMITDLSGRVVQSVMIEGMSSTITLNEELNGVYLVKFQEEGIAPKRILIER